jgi:hypothetical protein
MARLGPEDLHIEHKYWGFTPLGCGSLFFPALTSTLSQVISRSLLLYIIGCSCTYKWCEFTTRSWHYWSPWGARPIAYSILDTPLWDNIFERRYACVNKTIWTSWIPNGSLCYPLILMVIFVGIYHLAHTVTCKTFSQPGSNGTFQRGLLFITFLVRLHTVSGQKCFCTSLGPVT